MRISATCPKCKTHNTFADYNVVTLCRDCHTPLIHPLEDVPDRDDVPCITDIYPEPDPEPPSDVE